MTQFYYSNSSLLRPFFHSGYILAYFFMEVKRLRSRLEAA